MLLSFILALSLFHHHPKPLGPTIPAPNPCAMEPGGRCPPDNQ